ncbi:hypothetical protein MAPG_08483 [Magnaporthiopsis poae ATCC 64411]|uniref:DUF7587 domain-containing protein n=1 Tax=Magnaporthiopsis poae (strain ATCC 64411 / 73-15) TaxID=644358 RepID=A0A0C4E7H0_MAGP6|nr:hypothetical protein MAPG_08483 [Magnaporthiopsis poae ATCC 64411]
MPFDLDSYRCHSPPATLWKVKHWNSQFKRDELSGDLVAADPTREITTKLRLSFAAQDHFKWENRRPTCFQSTFSCYNHARNWGNGVRWIEIYEIDTTNLSDGVYIFDAKELASRMRIPYKHGENEFIFLHRIPGSAIRSTERNAPAEHVSRVGTTKRIVFVDSDESTEPASVDDITSGMRAVALGE